MKRTIVNPHWTNNAQTLLAAEYHYDDGRVLQVGMSIGDTSNPDVAEILSKFSPDEIKQNTIKVIVKANKKREEEKRVNLAREERIKNEELFAIKLSLFEIETIKNSTNDLLKRQIRKSKTPIEANAWAVGLMLDELNKQHTT